MLKHLLRAAVIAALFATPALAQATSTNYALVKVCKVAPPPVPNGTQFQFTVSDNGGPQSPPFMVPSGSPPDGTCWIAGWYDVGHTLQIIEVAQAGFAVQAITSATSPILSLSLPARSVTIKVVPNVNIVTYTNVPVKTGYLEVCKAANAPGHYTFSITPGGQTFALQTWSCTPPMQVPAGPVTIQETSMPSGIAFLNCALWSGGYVTACPVAANATTVTVAPGGIGNEIVVFVENISKGTPQTLKKAEPDAMMTMLKQMGAPLR